jgi:translation initiation factor IF-2
MVQHGTLKVGDYMLAEHHGKIKAMYDERGNIVNVAGPSTPVSVVVLMVLQLQEISLMCLKMKRKKQIASVLN